MPPTSNVTPSGVRWGPTAAGSHYLARNDHQHFAVPDRNRWNAGCNPRNQFDLFETAEANVWCDSRPHLWAVAAGLPEIGMDGECIAKFPERSNPTDDWHGYPVSALDRMRQYEHRPEPELVSRWFDDGLIDETQRARIKRGKV